MAAVIPLLAPGGIRLNANIKDVFTVDQRENEAITYVMNWAGELDEDSISTSTWSTEDSITIANEQNTTIEASCRLSSTPGRYRVVNKIVTTDGDTRERLINVTVHENSFDLSDYGLTWDYR